MANENIQLIIRTTNNIYTDFFIEISSLLTIYDLKQTITLNHPSKPVPKNQRLIYSGKLLDNKNILNQVFIKSNSKSSFMIHLVINFDKNELLSKTSEQSINESSISLHSIIYEQYMNELNKYQQQLQQFMLNPNEVSLQTNSETQIYSQLYYTHHQMYQNYVNHQRQTTLNQSTDATPSVENNHNEINQENHTIGILHILIELFILCSTFYLASTFNHILLVFIILVLLYFFFLIQQNRNVQLQEVPPVDEQPHDNNIEQEMNENENSNDLQSEQSSTNLSSQSEPITNNQTTLTHLLLAIISTFFSSFIPDRPTRI